MNAPSTPSTATTPVNTALHAFEVTGMTCGHCEKAVTQAIKKVDPAAEVKIDRTTNRVDVTSRQPRAALAHAIVDEGYSVAG
jgi:copper chaperone